MTPTTASVNPNQALWEKGDFTEIAAFMRHSGEALVDTLNVSAGVRVLDLGCGDGTTALPLARKGAEVTGIDIARNLVAAGNRRARQAGLTRLKFLEGDACRLEGVADDSFDISLSIFGAMFAPWPFEVAKELVRVTKPGGRIVMGNWIPGDATFVSQLLRISSAFTPPPPEGFVSPMTWGVEAHIIERFTQAGIPNDNISMRKDTFYFTSSDQSPTRFIELFREFYGPTMNAYEAARKNGKEDQIHVQLIELANSQNKSEGGTLIPATFMRVTKRDRQQTPIAHFWEAMARARAGQRKEALRLIRPFEEKYPNPGVALQWFALVYAFMGDEPNTVKWLERSADRHEWQALNLAVHPAYAQMRDSPAFRALEKRMGLIK